MCRLLEVEFWRSTEFWINVAIGILGIIIGYLAYKEASKAFKEANKAKDAATAAKEAAEGAATTVKIQTITIELSEIVQKLDKLDPKIDFTLARDLLNENNRRVKRLISPFKNEPEYKETIEKINTALDEAKKALEQVKPIDGEDLVKSSVYHAIESHFSSIAGLLAELMGLFERRTINLN